MVLLLEGDKYYFDEKLIRSILLLNNAKAHSMLQGCQPAELRDSSGSTLLHYSAHYGNAVMTKYLIERGCEIDAQNNDESTPLILAVESRNVNTVKILLDAGADIYPSHRSAGLLLKGVIVWVSLESELHNELSLVRHGILEPILGKFKENFKTSDNQAITKLLFENDCPLHHAIRVLKNAELTRYFLTRGYPVDARESKMGYTALRMAVKTGDLANVEVLLEHGADVNLQNREGETLLHLSYGYGGIRDLSEKQLKILRILMKSGASLSLTHKYGESVAEILLLYGQKEVVNIVLPYADPTTEYGMKKNTVLHILIMNKNIEDTEVFNFLSKKYFDVNATNSKGLTALQLAIVNERSVEIVDFLLKKGADISAFYTEMTTLKDLISKSWVIPDEDSTCVKIIELFLLYGGDLRKQLLTINTTLNHPDFDKSCLAKLLIAHLVLLEESGHNFRVLFVPGVKARPVLAELFKKYKLQIKEMKSIKVYKSITMLDLVAASERKLTRYAINDDLMSNFEVLSQNGSHLEWYYYKYVKKRVVRAVDVEKCQRKASLIISELTGLQQKLILDKIIDYLPISGLNSLSFV